MIIQLSSPSKTFLVGEYAVLAGGPALVINTAPRFQLHAARGGRGQEGIPPGSPAARWVDDHAAILGEWRLEFKDPHLGQGGFGASSAQFLFVHTLTTFLQASFPRAIQGVDRETIYNDFQVLTGGEASGADIMAQSVGKMARVERSLAEASAWPFAELSFAILRTKNKVATHAHLKQLDREPLHQLIGPVNNALASFKKANAQDFVRDVKAFGALLCEFSLQSAVTRSLLDGLYRQKWCLAAKGCGAMGADTIFTAFESADQAAAHEYFKTQNLLCVATEKDLSAGLEMNLSWASA